MIYKHNQQIYNRGALQSTKTIVLLILIILLGLAVQFTFLGPVKPLSSNNRLSNVPTTADGIPVSDEKAQHLSPLNTNKSEPEGNQNKVSEKTNEGEAIPSQREGQRSLQAGGDEDGPFLQGGSKSPASRQSVNNQLTKKSPVKQPD